MKTIQLEPKDDYRTVERAFGGLHAVPFHVRFPIGDESTKVLAPDGSVILVYLKGKLPEDLYKPSMKDWWYAAKAEVSNRFLVMCSKSMPGINKDGTETNRTRVDKEILKNSPARQGIIGTVVTKHQCYKTRLSLAHSELIDNNIKLIELVNSLYQENLPETYARQWAYVKDKPKARIGETAFSTGYFIKQHQCGLHPDMRNMRNVMSCIFPMGLFEGG